jgi:hypothetical protein
MVLTIVTGIVIYKYEIREDQKMASMGHLITKLFIVSVIAFIILLGMYFFIGDSGTGDGHVSIRKKLHVTIKDNNPCFYVDSFEGIDDFDINNLDISLILPRHEWTKATSAWNDNLNTSNPLHLSSIKEANQCIPYGIQNDITSVPFKKLKMDVLYSVTMEGNKRNLSQDKLKNGDSIWLHRAFYLDKNKTTGEIEVVMPDQTQVATWVKKIEDHNKSIETTKEKK